MIPTDYKSIDTSPKPSFCCMAMTGIVRAIGFVLFVACMYVSVCVFMSY